MSINFILNIYIESLMMIIDIGPSSQSVGIKIAKVNYKICCSNSEHNGIK
jgi:hypothetical protein